jgi:hypothetical protein
MTRATQKAREAEPTWSKSKGKGKAKVDDTTMEEVQMEKLKKLKVEIAKGRDGNRQDRLRTPGIARV